MLPKSFRPKKTYNLVRLGKANDGGYLVEKESMEKASWLLSLGVGEDWSFESDFSNNFTDKGKRVVCIDRVLHHRFYFFTRVVKYLRRFFTPPVKKLRKPRRYYRSNLRHFRKSLSNLITYPQMRKHMHKIEIGPDGDSGQMSVQGVMDKFSHGEQFFLKCDIEGAEYQMLQDILDHQKSMVGLAIEFHWIDLHRQEIEEFIEALDLELVHIHPNNHAKRDHDGNANVVEMSFALSPKALNANPPTFPHPLDSPNICDRPDVMLYFE